MNEPDRDRGGLGLTIVELDMLAASVADGHGVPVHGAPATGLPVLTNGKLGCDVLHIKAGDQFPIHTHPGDHLLYALSGEGTISVAGKTYTVRQGDIYMVEGAVPHAVGAVTDHVILAIGSPHKSVGSKDRMTFVDWKGKAVDAPVLAGGEKQCTCPTLTETGLSARFRKRQTCPRHGW